VPRSHVTTLLALAAACSLLAGCGSSSHEARRSSAGGPAASATSASAPHTATAESAESLLEPIARVGKVTITRGLLQHWTAIGVHGKLGAPDPPDFTVCANYLGLSGESTTEQLKAACKQKYEQSLHKALNLLIHVPWLISEAAEAGIRVDPARLARETSLSGPRGEETKGAMTTKGETLADYRLTLTLVALSARLDRKLEAQVPVTRARIADYYRLHKRSFAVPERRDLYVVRLGSRSEALKARRELEHGADFATIVNHSALVQPNGAHNGLLRGLQPKNWPEKPLPEEVFRAPLRTLEGPVHISFGYYLFEVVGRIPGRPSTLAEATPEVERELHELLRERIFSRFATAFTRKWAPRTVCLPGDLARYCRQYRSAQTSALEVPNLLF
jgi:hypothetical protein